MFFQTEALERGWIRTFRVLSTIDCSMSVSLIISTQTHKCEPGRIQSIRSRLQAREDLEEGFLTKTLGDAPMEKAKTSQR